MDKNPGFRSAHPGYACCAHPGYACYGGPWKENIRKIAASDPDIAWFDTQIVVDNESHEIKIAA